jgi:hypothetical protein
MSITIARFNNYNYEKKMGRPSVRLSQNPQKGLNLEFGRIQDSPLQRVSGLR